jgi:hypothetical protein
MGWQLGRWNEEAVRNLRGSWKAALPREEGCGAQGSEMRQGRISEAGRKDA